MAVPPRILTDTLIHTQKDMADVETYSFAGGKAAAFTRRSPFKETVNEDALALIPAGTDAGVLVVADGLGGLPAGEAASRLAVQRLAEAVRAAQRDNAALRDAILNGIEQANREIIALGAGSATTIAVVELQGRLMRSYHVGDSLILVTGQRGKVKYQTMPHSPVGYAVESGMLDESEALHHAERNIVSNVIGSPEMRIDIGPTFALAPRDTLLLASDGAPDNLYMSELVDCIRAGSLRWIGRELAARCHERMRHPRPGVPSHPDDLSFILYRPR